MNSRVNPPDLLVSVVIPTYNREHMIVDALESVRRQSYRPLHIVVVDDGSNDNTQKVVEAWSEKNRDLDIESRYVFQENSGGNVARNNGIKNSTGKLIAFLDSDDLWHPEKVAKQIEIFENKPKTGAVYCGLQHVDLETSSLISKPNRSYPTGDLLDQILVSDVTAPTSTYMVRKSVFDQVGMFDEDLQARQDWDMWIRIAAEFEIGCVPQVLVDFREHSGPRTYSDPSREIRAYQRILQKYKHLHKRCSWIQRRKIHASYFKRRGRVAFHYQNSRATAFGAYLRSLVNWPFDFDCYAALLGLAAPRYSRKLLNHFWNAIFGKTGFSIKSH